MPPKPVRTERWQFAQESQRRYQERKALSVRGSEQHMITGATRQSLFVREWIRTQRPGFSPTVVAEIGSGAHGLIWSWPDPVQRIAIDPLAAFYSQRFHFIQSGVRDVLQATGESVPLRDSSIDLVLSDNVLDHVQDPVRFLGQIERILSPRGLLYLTVHFSHPAWNLAARGYNALHASGLKLWIPAFPSHPYSFEREDVLGMLDVNGLAPVSIEHSQPAMPQRKARARRLRDLPKLLVFKDATIRILAHKRS